MKDQVFRILLTHHIHPHYKGFHPLIDLLCLRITFPERPIGQLTEEVAQQHQISTSVLKSRIRRIAAHMRYCDYATFCEVMGTWRYNYGTFISILADESSKHLSSSKE